MEFNYSIEAKPTIGPKNILFRSQLEAQWAYIFDDLHWDWEYEPYELKHYIPDFILTGFKEEILVEIKPVLKMDDFDQYKKKIMKSGWKKEFCIFGAKYFYSNFRLPHDIVLGKLYYELEINNKKGWIEDEIALIYCNVCNSFSLNEIMMSWSCKKCLRAEGDHHDWLSLLNPSYARRFQNIDSVSFRSIEYEKFSEWGKIWYGAKNKIKNNEV